MLVDEWQRHPPVWDLVRRSVDRDASPGRFLLTGSAIPTSAPTHSGAGRIVQLRMRPMSLADPALAARLLGTNAAALLAGRDPARAAAFEGPLLGALFESLVTLSVRVYAQAAEATVHHLRTRNSDHEVDLIVERDDGRVVAIEIKLSPSVDEADIKHLHWLRERFEDLLLDSVVITTGHHAYRRADGIAVVPAALLGA